MAPEKKPCHKTGGRRRIGGESAREWSTVDMDVDIAIAGGGLAGLALAVGLQERGIHAVVFEKASALRTDSATGISMALNGLRALEGLKPGLSTQFGEIGLFTDVYVVSRDAQGGERRFPVMHKQGEFYMVGWRFSQELLASLLDQSRVVGNHRFLCYQPIPGGVLAQFLVKDGEDRPDLVKVVRAKLLVGADGLWSTVRSRMVGDEPRYLNFVNWNALVYTPRGKVFNYREGEVNMIHDESERIVGYISDVGRGYCLWLLRCADPDGELQKDFLERYNAGFDRNVSKQRALAMLDGMKGWEDLRSAIEATDEDSIYERRSMDRIPLAKWSDADGHVLLIGDAAHAMYSGPGMGARTAFEDSHQLAILLEEAFKSADVSKAIEQAIQRFEEVRIKRVEKIHQFANDLTEQRYFQSKLAMNLSPQQKKERLDEFVKWTCQYPQNMYGDPNSTWWKP